MKKTILILSVLFFLSCKKENLYNIPNVITPNGDGVNDTWVLPFTGSEVIISDRNGQTIYHSTNYQNDWSGNVGVYYYTVYYNGSASRGSLTVLK